MPRLHSFIIFVALLLAASPWQARAQCTTALVLGLDVSSSVDEDEYALQAQGLAKAFRDPEVIDLILASPGSGIMAAAFEWSGIWQQTLVADWAWLDSEPAILAFADRLSGYSRDVESWPTALGRAAEFGANLLHRTPRDCWRYVLDISGDGVNNHGVGPDWYRRRGDFEGLIVNGLVIQGEQPDPLPYYQQFVIHGPGAFIEIADGYEDFDRAIRRKLLRELQPIQNVSAPGHVPTLATCCPGFDPGPRSARKDETGSLSETTLR